MTPIPIVDSPDERAHCSPARNSGPLQQPLVSVCISAYDVERFLGTALGSVLGQTYRNIEVILVDNGSVDRTFEVAQSFSDERLHCFRVPKNLGAYQAMNKVISMAKGELVAVYHSDDCYEPEIIQKEVAYLQAHPHVGAVFALEHFMDEEGRIFGGADLPKELLGKESLSYEQVFRFVLRNKNILFCCPTFMVRRAVLERVGLFNAEIYEIGSDLEMWLRIARQYPIGILNERLIRYRIGRQQWTARYRRLRTQPEHFFRVMDDYIRQDRWLEKLNKDDLAEYAFHRCDDDTFCAVNLVISGEAARAEELLKGGFPWHTLLVSIKRRKIRTIILRATLRCLLKLRAIRPLVAFLRRIGP